MPSSELPNYFCRVCGFRNSLPPWGKDGRTATFEYCPCCGVEFGYQDSTPAGARKFRSEWLSNGCAWSEPSLRVADWRFEDQVGNIPNKFK